MHKNNFYFFRILKSRTVTTVRDFKFFVFRKSKKKYFLEYIMYKYYRQWCVI